MISSLSGTVASAVGTTCVIEVAGVGYRLQVTPAHSAQLRVGGEARVTTTLIVRDDALVLFGFESAEHLEIFELLTSVSSVGPKSAMAVLSVLEPDQVAAAVTAEDDAAFRTVPGIGTKTAKLIIVQLTGKIDAVVQKQSANVGRSSVQDDVVTALTELGWTQKTAQQVVASIADGLPDEPSDVSELLRRALARLGPRR